MQCVSGSDLMVVQLSFGILKEHALRIVYLCGAL